ncbi:MAG: hypothetical protein AAF430_06335 [Myxococcota bacterium]
MALRREARRRWSIGVALACVFAASVSDATQQVEYVYIEAGEGGSSGGHVALRLGDLAYHYQREADGAVELRREGWRAFVFRYRVSENRNLQITQIATTAPRRTQLQERLDTQFLRERAQRDRLHALRRDVALLAALNAPEGRVPIAGAGFFDLEALATTDAERAGERALRRLRERLLGRGAGPSLAFRRRVAESAIAHLRPETRAPRASEALDYGFSRRFADAYAAWLALRVLEEAPPLRQAALRRVGAEALPLRPPERLALARQARRIEASLIALIDSARPDWGRAFLLGMARLAAIEGSLATHQLQLLDAYPEEVLELAPAAWASLDVTLDLQEEWRRSQWLRARQALIDAPDDETRLGDLELAQSDYAELIDARTRHRPLRIPLRNGLPEASRFIAPTPRPRFARDEGARLLALARVRLEEAEASHDAQAAYDLVSRNCVTELFAHLDAALGDVVPSEAGDGAGGAPGFVPVLSAQAVAERWGRGDSRTLLSHRRTLVGESWWSALRESNTLTATRYESPLEDSLFLFFTDNAAPVRPLLGAANLATGVVGGALGLFTLPWDQGALFSRSVRGSVASVPELFFVNIRKGTYPLLPPSSADADVAATPEPQ